MQLGGSGWTWETKVATVEASISALYQIVRAIPFFYLGLADIAGMGWVS